MKKPTSFVLAFGMIFLTCIGAIAQKPSLRGIERSKRESVREPSKRKSNGPIEFDSVRAFTQGAKVLLKWQMSTETANMGFFIHRVDGKGETVINEQIVLGSAARAGRYPLSGEQYAFLDSFGGPGSVYFIESIDLDGNRAFSQTIATQYSKNFPSSGLDVQGNANEYEKFQENALQTGEPALTKELVSLIESQPTFPDPEKHKWVMSHPGVRIGVRTEGIYRVPFAQLQSAGFDTSLNDKSFWQLYRNGVEQAITLDEAGGYIEFYGKGVDTPETDVQGYFLIVGDIAGKRMENSVSRPPTSSITLGGYNQTSTYKERTLYLDTILNGSPENYWGRGINSTGTDISFDLTAVDFNSPTATINLKVQGFSSGVHSVRITLNGQVLSPLNGVAQFPLTSTQTIPTSLLKDASLGQGPNILNLASIGPSGDFNLFDTVNISFARKHIAIQNTLKSYTVNLKKTRLSGFSSANVRVLDVTFQNDPQIVTNLTFQDQGGTFGTELGGTRGRILFAAEQSAILAPVSVRGTDSEILASNNFGADLIIISHKNFLTQAQTWANYRIAQGFSVKIVDIDEIFNEFNYGNLSSDSIESFLDYAYNNWTGQPNAPKYVLLLGDATRDPRNYAGGTSFNLIPTRFVTTIFTETGSDESLADFNNDGLAEMAIGRIPARLGSDIDAVLQKVTNWETNLGSDPLARGSLFAVDQFDSTNNIDFTAVSNRISGELPPGSPVTTIIRNQNTHTELMDALNTGKYAVNYTGHGSLGVWANQSFFWNGDVSSVNNAGHESLFTMLTCLNGYFLNPAGNSLAETLLASNNGGAVATWASTGLTTTEVQETMARRFYKKLGEGTIPRLGDLIKDAKTVIAGGTDVRLSWSLLGDPMLKVR
jgi:hypothetical protein